MSGKSRLFHSLTMLLVCMGLFGCRERLEVKPERPAVPVKPLDVETAGRKVLMMHYMPWYMTPAIRGRWNSHWTAYPPKHKPDQMDENGLPDIWSHYHPLIGPYDSTDPAAIECHLLQMKLAGVDGVLADWYGIGRTDDQPAIHDATCALFDATGKFGMHFAACYEDRSIELLKKRGKLEDEDTTEHLVDTLQWMQAEWFSQPQYLTYGTRPLLLNFGPMHVRDAAVWDAAFNSIPTRPAFYPLHHLWKKVGGDGGFMWVHHDAFESLPATNTVLIRIGETFRYPSKNPKEVIVSAYPGFKDVYGKGGRILDHRGGATLRETLQVGMAGDWPIIQLITWNDYGEGPMIEPTHEFGYTFLEIVQQARRSERGNAFPFSASDLRLPARLYALRKAGVAPAGKLDSIAHLLSIGACERARRQLDALTH